jgi:hypothetical protein
VTDRPDAVALAYVHSNEVAYSWHYCVWRLWLEDLRRHQRIGRGGVIAIRTNAGQLVSARNKAVKELLASDVPWVLWLDTDMGFGADLLERLLEVADPVERPIVGALCFSQRELGPDGMGGYYTMPTPTVMDWVNPEDTPDGVGGFDVRLDYPRDRVVRVAGTGSAAILVHRSVYERVALKYGAEWYHRVPARDGSVGEDLSLCMRATAMDIPIHVHTGVKTTHAKTIWLSEVDFQERFGAPPATQEVAVLVPVLGRPEHAEPFMRSLRASTGLARCYAICDADDEEAIKAWHAEGAYTVIRLPRNGRPGSFAEKVNTGYRHTGDEETRHGIPPEPWLLLVGSDVAFHPGWLDHALHAAGDRYHVIGTNDLGNPLVIAGEHATHPLIRRSYVDEVGASWDGPGVVCHEGYGHMFVDNEIVEAAKQRGVWVAAPASKVEHLHPLWGKGPLAGQPEGDEVYKLGFSHAEADQALFRERLVTHGGGA